MPVHPLAQTIVLLLGSGLAVVGLVFITGLILALLGTDEPSPMHDVPPAPPQPLGDYDQ